MGYIYLFCLIQAHVSTVAISFTLCSMISASQPIPTECAFWAPGAEAIGWTADMERYLSPCIA